MRRVAIIGSGELGTVLCNRISATDSSIIVVEKERAKLEKASLTSLIPQNIIGDFKSGKEARRERRKLKRKL